MPSLSLNPSMATVNMSDSHTENISIGYKTRRSHRKSRHGCQKCKDRRIKVCKITWIWIGVGLNFTQIGHVVTIYSAMS
ncbi:C6 transcription factor [Penicillium malachiteum]|uniref:C6 transcription factor n=1 Tax=Penicillium malachiteum TaxID=1324776 RepID=UPI00254714FD|nr:C6 transcription factor [Penicillium malachiteum]KAJ5731463.1 C6 transcription factor [Penicillium malachiteum]